MAPQDYQELSRLARRQAAQLFQRARRVISSETQHKLIVRANNAQQEALAYETMMVVEIARQSLGSDTARIVTLTEGVKIHAGMGLQFDADDSAEADWCRPRKHSLLREGA